MEMEDELLRILSPRPCKTDSREDLTLGGLCRTSAEVGVEDVDRLVSLETGLLDSSSQRTGNKDKEHSTNLALRGQSSRI